jgi:transcriptional regulator with PAS, ATPase and Fis domain
MTADSSQATANEELSSVCGISAAMRTLETVVLEIVPTNIPVPLVGESGIGKEIFSRRLHRSRNVPNLQW